MNKSELVAMMAEKAELSKKDAEKALNAFLESVQETVKSGDKISLAGFGKVELRKRKSREGKNPRTGEKLTMAACGVPAFKAGKAFKDFVK